MNILEVEHITKQYVPGAPILQGVSFAVPRGAVFGFLGLNGAGKTTTIRIISGLLSADSGSVRIFGKPVRPGDKGHLASMGFVTDEPLYFEWMPGNEYLAFIGAMYGLEPEDIEQRSAELLSFFDLQEKAGDPIGTYSTGMKKKISLAAAIIHHPEIVVLDEPLEGIDAVAASAVKETLTMMAGQGSTIFITSHVLDTVEKLCTEVAILHQGKVLLQSAISDIYSRAREIAGEREFRSLEHLFVGLVSDELRRKQLFFLSGRRKDQ